MDKNAQRVVIEYLVSGRYATEQDIRRQLCGMLSDSGADVLVLLVADERTLYQSLLLVQSSPAADTSSNDVKDLTESVESLGADFRKKIINERNQSATLIAKHSDSATVMADRASSLIGDLVAEHHYSVELRGISSDSESDPKFVAKKANRSSELALTVVLGCRASKAVKADLKAANTAATIDTRMNSILALVSVSAPVQVRVSVKNFEKTEELLAEKAQSVSKTNRLSGIGGEASFVRKGRWPTRAGSNSDPVLPHNWKLSLQNFAQIVLEAACEITQSDAGNLYLGDAGNTELRLVAQLNNSNPQETIKLSDRANKKYSVVGWVFKRRRPLLINDIGQFKHERKDVEVLWTGSDDMELSAELAVPIQLQGIERLDKRLLGVINVERARPKGSKEITSGYTYADLSVLTGLAYQVCLQYSNEMLGLVSRSFRDADDYSQFVQSDEWAYDTGDAEPSASIPPDFRPALRPINKLLRETVEITGAHSGTVRLIDRSQQILLRTAVVETDAGISKESEPTEIRLSDKGSVNAWVAREGKECYLESVLEWNIVREQYEKEYPGLVQIKNLREATASEFCLPIKIGHRVVGTLNLESGGIGGFETTRDFVRSVAHRLGVILPAPRVALQRDIWTKDLGRTLARHELLKCVDYLSDLEGLVVSENVPVLESVKKVQSALSAVLELDANKQVYNRNESIFEILVSVVRRVGLGDIVRWRNGSRKTLLVEIDSNTEAGMDFPAWKRLLFARTRRSFVASALRLALVNIIENIGLVVNSLPLDEQDVYIGADIVNFGGEKMYQLRIQNRLRFPLSEELATALYRVPINDNGRPHVGAFDAAMVLIELGCFVYVGYLDDKKIVTKVDVPLNLVELAGSS